MNNTAPSLTFQPAALRTLEMVGRERFLVEARAKASQGDPSKPRVVFIIGQGGAGKTMRLQTLLARDQADNPSYVLGSDTLSAQNLVDLYHIVHHTAVGLASAIRQTLAEPKNEFARFDRELRIFNSLQQSQYDQDIGRQREIVLKEFAENITKLSASGPVVLALDTAERLAYVAQDKSRRVGHCWEWLLSSLPQWGNVVLFIAGRAPSLELMRQIEYKFAEIGARNNVSKTDTTAFDVAEVSAYFDAVETALLAEGQITHAKRVRDLPPSMRQAAHACSLGIPILLSMVVDAMRTNNVPKLLQKPSAYILAMSAEDRRNAKADLEKELIDQLVGNESDEARTIATLGRVPRGADNQLLAQLLGITPLEAARRIDELRRYSFVKYRPDDPRVFLHDEMYDLLKRYCYDSRDDRRESSKAWPVIDTYYKDQLDAAKVHLNDLFAPAEQRNATDIDLNAIFTAQARRSALLTDDLFYRLRHDATDGFRHYYRYMLEATMSSDSTLDAQVEAEMAMYLQETEDGADDEARQEIKSVLKVRSVPRIWAEKHYRDVIDLAKEIRESDPAWMNLDVNAHATLDAYEASSYTYLGSPGDFEKAQHLIDQVIDNIRDYLKNNPPPESGIKFSPRLWRARAIQGFAYHVRGYLSYVQGRMRSAVDDYQHAGAIWGEVDIIVQQAGVLNDMGFAMSELGDWVDARENVREALRLRQELGHRAPVALSYNTLGLIELRAGNHETALNNSQTAFTLSRALDYKQGRGLALIALAEESRRFADQQLSLDIGAKVLRLREAISYADEALEIFEDTQEIPRQIEALIEKGCAFRNWARLQREYPNPRESLDRLVKLSDKALTAAAKLAEPDILYRLLDARVNRVVLAYYAGRDDLYAGSIKDAEAVIDNYAAEYRIRQDTGAPFLAAKSAQPNLWLQLGKLHTIHGHIRFENLQKTGEGLRIVIENYMLGLEYNALFGENSIGDQQSKNQIAFHLKHLPSVLQRRAVQLTRELENQWHLTESRLKRLLRNRALWLED